MLQAFTSVNMTLQDLSLQKASPLVMGILNVTPDSFSDGGQHNSLKAAVTHAEQLLEAGADIIDVGGESTRPGAAVIPEAEEIRRVVPVIRQLKKTTNAVISIDTSKSAVAKAALDAGATIVNDVTGARDPSILEVTAQYSAAIVLMHMRGTPQTMKALTSYDDVVEDVFHFLKGQVQRARAAGISTIIADPGIGFAKDQVQNLKLLKNITRFHDLEVPLLVGPSRKSFIGNITGQKEAQERIEGTIATCVLCATQNVQILRVHDVREVCRALEVTRAILNVGHN